MTSANEECLGCGCGLVFLWAIIMAIWAVANTLWQCEPTWFGVTGLVLTVLIGISMEVNSVRGRPK